MDGGNAGNAGANWQRTGANPNDEQRESRGMINNGADIAAGSVDDWVLKYAPSGHPSQQAFRY